MKNFLLTVVALIAVLIVGAVWMLSRVNTEGNKQLIASGFQEATGYELVIGGDLSLSLFPSLGLSLNDVRLRNPGVPQELASTSRALLQVPLGSLLRGEVVVEEISINDFHANYFVNADGVSIWDLDESSQQDQAGSTGDPVASASGAPGNFSIRRINIADASIDIQDQAQGSRFRIDQLNLESRNTNINGDPFSISISFDYENNGMSAAVPVNLSSDVLADLGNGNLELQNLRFSVTPMLINGQISVANFNSSPSYTGALSAERFDLVGLLQSLGMMEVEATAMTGISTNRQLAFEMDFSGDANQAAIPNLSLDLAGTTVEANAEVRMATDFAPMSINYSVNAGNLDLTPYFPASESEAEQTEAAETPETTLAESGVNPAAQYQPETEIPVELLNSLSLLGSVSLEAITVGEFRFDDVNIFTNIEDGVMDVEIPPISAFEGSVQSTMRLDAQAQTPTVNFTLATNNINLVNLAPSLSRFNTVTGFLQSESNYTARGTTTSELTQSLSGNTAFNVNENSVDIGVIKQVFTAIAALSPTGEAIQQWPDVIRFTDMSGYLLLEEGLNSNQQLQLRMDNFDVSGSGGFDLDAGSFDYDLAFTVLGEPATQTIPINSLYHNVAWPVDCSAAFSEEVNRYCRPDFTRVRQIFTQIGTNAARGRLEEAITDQVPDQLQDTARGLLRSILN